MTDFLTVAQRSRLMSKIKGKKNKSTEVALMEIFKEAGLTGWRRHYPIDGRPDFVFRPEKVAVFVDGCFWHGCPQHFREPTTNAAFWQKKIGGNCRRDKKTKNLLS